MATGATVQATITVLATKGSCGARGHAHAMIDKRKRDKTDTKLVKVVENTQRCIKPDNVNYGAKSAANVEQGTRSVDLM